MKLLIICIVVLSLHAADKVPVVTQKQLDKTVAHWQHRLKLDDWRISISTLPLAVFDEGTNGFMQPYPLMREAAIGVVAPRDYALFLLNTHAPPMNAKAVRSDIDFTIVHELVHLRLLDLMLAKNEELRSVNEMTVDRLTQALLSK